MLRREQNQVALSEFLCVLGLIVLLGLTGPGLPKSFIIISACWRSMKDSAAATSKSAPRYGA